MCDKCALKELVYGNGVSLRSEIISVIIQNIFAHESQN